MTAETQRAPWLPIWAGLCASLVGIGLARFAYTPLVPALIEAHWFASSAVVYLGAANLAGYLVGALAGRRLARRWSSALVLRGMMVLVSLAFLACAWPLSVAWFFAWRLLSGVAGGVIMVLAASAILPHVAATRRGLASGAIFLGIGLGIAGAASLVPWLLGKGCRKPGSGWPRCHCCSASAAGSGGRPSRSINRAAMHRARLQFHRRCWYCSGSTR